MIAIRHERPGERILQVLLVFACLVSYGAACRWLQYWGTDVGKVAMPIGTLVFSIVAFIKFGPGLTRWLLAGAAAAGYTLGYWLITLL